MKTYLDNNITLFKDFCLKNEISMEKALKMPKCYNSDELYIQMYDETETGQGLRNNQTADVLLIIRKKENGLDFEITSKGKIALALG